VLAARADELLDSHNDVVTSKKLAAPDISKRAYVSLAADCRPVGDSPPRSFNVSAWECSKGHAYPDVRTRSKSRASHWASGTGSAAQPHFAP
jgi:hypothetical protein